MRREKGVHSEEKDKGDEEEARKEKQVFIQMRRREGSGVGSRRMENEMNTTR